MAGIRIKKDDLIAAITAKREEAVAEGQARLAKQLTEYEARNAQNFEAFLTWKKTMATWLSHLNMNSTWGELHNTPSVPPVLANAGKPAPLNIPALCRQFDNDIAVLKMSVDETITLSQSNRFTQYL